MLANLFRDRVTIQVRIATPTAMGETVVWRPVNKRYARVIPLDAKAQAIYQQLKSEVSHKVIFRGTVGLSLGNNRILWGNKTLEPVGPEQIMNGSTIIMVKEV